jgi:hypothetical protein
MRRAFLLASLIALPASAQLLSGIEIRPNEISVAVGETTTTRAYAQLGCCSSFPWHVTFGADGAVAFAEGVLASPKIEADVRITGRAPGTTPLVSPAIGGGRWPLATIHVYCKPEAPVTPVAERIVTTAPERPLTLAVIAMPLPEKAFTWYRGRAGDTSQPIPAVGPELRFVPETYGTHFVWVSAASACSASMAEFRIDAVRLRRRASR